ncbi:MAG: cysteine hydrolase family protein [Chloroherpetonaceae bacterium]|nr:cysteine hydrolase family protein [Chloroherpetonaceae bacterium]
MRLFFLTLSLILLPHFRFAYAQSSQVPKKALIIIDIQNDYFEGGSSALVNPLKASENAKRILEWFRSERFPVIHIRHLSANPKSKSFNGQSFGSQIHNNVAPKSDSSERVIIKHFPNSFQETSLRAYLNELKVTDLVIVGMMTHMCVEATVRAAKDFGFQNTVIADACATKDLELNGEKIAAETVHKAFLAAMNGYYAKVTSTDEFLPPTRP